MHDDGWPPQAPPPPPPPPPPHHGAAPPPPPVPPGLGPRVRRGDVRTALLRLLTEEPRNGYQLIEEIERRSGGIWRPSPGSVYPALQQMEDEGLVAGEDASGSRAYRLTGEGRSHADPRAEPWADVRRSLPEDRHELRLLWGQLGEAFVHLTHVADDRQVAETKKLLRSTRQAMFRILAEDT
ncbi:PadR family transcriptional regulator [Microbispora amethystogenes]|uniref:PadR family transcriptional regulator n=1 Tax=Microbispora amethystogenes TaxID=1427754 RepID=UPI0033F3288A